MNDHSIHPFPAQGGLCAQCTCGRSCEVTGADESSRLAIREWSRRHLTDTECACDFPDIGHALACPHYVKPTTQGLDF